ncbi:hypothetical protein D3C84_996880 [compost metagenome]
MADLQAVQVQGLAQAFDLRLGHLHFGTPQLGEILRRDDAGQQPEHHQHHQQFKQGEPALSTRSQDTRTLFHDDLTQSAEGSQQGLCNCHAKVCIRSGLLL